MAADKQLVKEWINDWSQLDKSLLNNVQSYAVTISSHLELVTAILAILEDSKFHPEVRMIVYHYDKRF